MESIFTSKEPTSEQQVADKLRLHILAGNLPVGEFLSQRKLAEWTGSSVISVRGALRQLENEGLVENVPRAGVRIPRETPSAVRDRYLVREALETAAVRKVCGTLSPDTAKHLMKTAESLDKLASEGKPGNYSKFGTLHHDFHLCIAEHAGSPLLVQMLRRVINPGLMLLNAKRSLQIPSESHRNHVRLATALIDGPVEEAIEVMKAHIQTGLESELAAL